MSSKLVDLGKRLEINMEEGCWISSIGPKVVFMHGDLGAIERTLELALIALREGRAG